MDYRTLINERNTKYKLNLNHVILPNLYINSRLADRISQIPYIYVQLKSTSTTYDPINKTISNNRKLESDGIFKLLTTDTSHINSSNFIKLTNTSSTHVIPSGVSHC